MSSKLEIAKSKPGALDLETAVRERYTKGAQAREAALCCPIDYDARYLKAIPEAVLERDYGCGDPSRYVRAGDTVLDLGSGGGKIAFIAAQLVGETGSVIGVDMNDEMLALARTSAPLVAKQIGYANTAFRRGRIQDLALDLDRVETWLAKNPVQNARELSALDDYTEKLRREAPLIADASVDIVISNCVLNLVRDADKPKLIREIFRVLKPGGRIAISDIVCDEVPSQRLKDDPKLWSGCISGAFHEKEILEELAAAGFYGIAFDKWDNAPWQTVEGIEFRSVTVTAHKGNTAPCLEANQAVIYRGPWKQVEDDDGHMLRRGERVAVCDKTFAVLTAEPYAASIIAIEPLSPIAPHERKPFDCARTAPRSPRETKGQEYRATQANSESCCGPSECCS